MKRLFVDTAGWMAMADGKDPLHAASLSARDHWMESGGILVTSNYVLDETLTLIRMRLGMPATQKWWGLVSESPRCKVDWVTPHQASKAIQWFFKWHDQSFSFTDCTSFVLMQDRGMTEVLTADRHFAIAGFKIFPATV